MKWIAAIFVLLPGESVGEQEAYIERHVASLTECRQALRIVSKEMKDQKLDFQWYGVCYDQDSPGAVPNSVTLGIDQDYTIKKYVSPTDGDKD